MNCDSGVMVETNIWTSWALVVGLMKGLQLFGMTGEWRPLLKREGLSYQSNVSL